MNISPVHLDALETLGYTRAEARFLYLAATHSGYFLARQFLAFQGVHWGKRTTVFWSKLERQKHARIERFPKSGTIYHLSSRQLYRHIGKPALRHRRIHELDFIKRRIAILDFILGHQGYEYLETEAEKVSYFSKTMGIDAGHLPAWFYLTRNGSGSNVRYFSDHFPILLDPPPAVVTFTYFPEGASGFPDFVRHLKAYLPLFRELSEFRMLYVSRTDSHFERATEIFNSLVKIPMESDIAEDLVRYFRIRKSWDQKQYARVSDADLIFRNHARGRFKGEIFEGLYRGWKMGLVNEAAIRTQIGSNARKHAVAFGTLKLCPLPVPGAPLVEAGEAVTKSDCTSGSERAFTRRGSEVVRSP